MGWVCQVGMPMTGATGLSMSPAVNLYVVTNPATSSKRPASRGNADDRVDEDGLSSTDEEELDDGKGQQDKGAPKVLAAELRLNVRKTKPTQKGRKASSEGDRFNGLSNEQVAPAWLPLLCG